MTTASVYIHGDGSECLGSVKDVSLDTARKFLDNYLTELYPEGTLLLHPAPLSGVRTIWRVLGPGMDSEHLTAEVVRSAVSPVGEVRQIRSDGWTVIP